MDDNDFFRSTIPATVANIWMPWCDTSPTAYVVIFHIIMFALAGFNAIFVVFSLYKVATLSIPIHSGIKIVFFAINITFCFSGIAYIIHLSMGYYCSEVVEWVMIGIMGVDGYQYGLALLYLLYFIRLWSIFHADGLTQQFFGISNIFFVIGGIAFIFLLVLPSVATYYWEILEWDTALMLVNIFTCVNAISSIYLLVLFWNKVKQLGRIQSMSSNVILGPAIRYALCAFMSFLSTEFVNAVSVYRAYFDDNSFWWGLHVALLGIDMSVNLICLFLQFSFGSKYYFKYFGSLHSLIEAKVIREMSGTDKSSQNVSKDVAKIEFESKGSTTGPTITAPTVTTTPQNESKTVAVKIVYDDNK